MRNKRFINKTGYTAGTKTSNNPVNIIPSQDITMKNVNYPLMGVPLDQYGNPIGQPTMMMPNEDYFFDGASYVEERPITEMQMGGWSQQNPWEQQYSTQENPVYYQGTVPPQNRLTNNARSPQLSTYSPDVFNTIQQGAENNMQQQYDEIYGEQELNNSNQKPLYQFANPYGGQDLNTSLFNFGSSVQEGNGLGIGVFGGLSLLEGSKSFLQGFGSANRTSQNMKNFYDGFRQNMVGNSQYLKNGGIVDKNLFKNLLKTNKVKNYTYNTETGNYEVEFE